MDVLKTLSEDVVNNALYPPEALPVLNSKEEQDQWEAHNERFTLYVDEDSEEVRVRAKNWVTKEGECKCTYRDVTTDIGELPLGTRQSLATQAAAFWSDYYGRLPMWRAAVNRLSWKREVDEHGITVPGSMALSYL